MSANMGNQEQVQVDRVLDHFSRVDITGILLPMIVVYHNPIDYPDKYVARLHGISGGRPIAPTNCVVVGDSLEEVRAAIPTHMTRMDRVSADDPVIIEIWLSQVYIDIDWGNQSRA